MSYDIFQPVTSDEAIELLSASPAPFDSPTQHRYRSLDHTPVITERICRF